MIVLYVTYIFRYTERKNISFQLLHWTVAFNLFFHSSQTVILYCAELAHSKILHVCGLTLSRNFLSNIFRSIDSTLNLLYQALMSFNLQWFQQSHLLVQSVQSQLCMSVLKTGTCMLVQIKKVFFNNLKFWAKLKFISCL